MPGARRAAADGCCSDVITGEVEGDRDGRYSGTGTSKVFSVTDTMQ